MMDHAPCTAQVEALVEQLTGGFAYDFVEQGGGLVPWASMIAESGCACEADA